MKSEKFIPFILPVVCVALGAFAFSTADSSLQMICYFTSALLIVFGLIFIVKYLLGTAQENFASNGFVIGFILLLLGVAAVVRASSIVESIPFVLGFLIAVNGIRELQNAIDVYKLQLNNQWIVVVIALVNLILGIILMVNPGFTAAVLMKVIGGGLVVSGLADFVTTLIVLRKSSKKDDMVILEAESTEAVTDTDNDTDMDMDKDADSNISMN